MYRSKYAPLHGGLLARKGEAIPAVALPMINIAYRDLPPPKPPAEPLDEEFYDEVTEADTLEDDTLLEADTLEDGTLLEADTLEPSQPLWDPNRHNMEFEDPVTAKNEAPLEVIERDGYCGSEDIDCTDYAPDTPHSLTTQYKISVHLSGKQRQLLRIVSAVMNIPQQQILSEAINDYLGALRPREMSGCACFNKRFESA